MEILESLPTDNSSSNNSSENTDVFEKDAETQNLCEHEEIMKSLSRYTVRSMRTYFSSKCGLCNCSFCVGEQVICLPCQHIFHEYCIEDWLKCVRFSCPLDGRSVVRGTCFKGVGETQKLPEDGERDTSFAANPPDDNGKESDRSPQVTDENASLVPKTTGISESSQRESKKSPYRKESTGAPNPTDDLTERTRVIDTTTTTSNKCVQTTVSVNATKPFKERTSRAEASNGTESSFSTIEVDGISLRKDTRQMSSVPGDKFASTRSHGRKNRLDTRKGCWVYHNGSNALLRGVNLNQ